MFQVLLWVATIATWGTHGACQQQTLPGMAWPPADRTAGPDKTDRHSDTLHPQPTQYCSPAEQPITHACAAGQALHITHARSKVPHNSAHVQSLSTTHTHMPHCLHWQVQTAAALLVTPHTHAHAPQYTVAAAATALRSELHQLLSCVANLLQVGYASKLDHGWGPTHGHDGIWSRRQQVLPHHVLVDEAAAVLPVLRGPVEQAWNRRQSVWSGR